MSSARPEGPRNASDWRLPRCLGYCLILGLFLTLRGYHSFDGDQAYRLPLLLHRLDPTIYADDPFVRAFDLTFLATCRGIDDLARAVWPDRKPYVSWVAITLLLVARAGNIGTNHLFEAMV